MKEHAMVLTAFCLAYAGFGAMSLAMDRHYEDVFRRALTPRHRGLLRIAGWVGLACSLWACATVYGWSYGMVEWIGMLAIAGLLLIWALAYRAVLAAGLAAACAVVAPVLAWV